MDHGEHVHESESLLQLVSFIIGEEEFGVDILNVQEIIRLVEMTDVPNAPAFIEGVINLRGRIIPVVDLRERFNFPSRESDDSTRIVVVELERCVVGFLVDAVRQVIRVEREIIDPPPELARSIDSRYITGVAKLDGRLLILLDLNKVVSIDEQQQVGALEQEEVAS